MGLRSVVDRASSEAVRLGASAATFVVRMAAGVATDEHPHVVPPPGHTTRDIARPDGASIRVRLAGRGPTVVLLHGYGLGAASWNAVAARLVERGHRVVSLDWRAHGASTTGGARVTTAALRADLIAVLEALEVEDAVLVGHSTGGYVAIATLVEQPEVQRRLRGLVLVSTLAGDLLDRAPDRSSGARLRGSVPDRIARNSTLGLLLSGFVAGFGISPVVSREFLDEFAETDHGALTSLLTELAERSYHGRLGDIHLDTIVLCGDEDRTTPPTHSDAIADEIPGASRERVAGAGHLLTWQHPGRVVDAILALSADREVAPDDVLRRAVLVMNPASGSDDADATEAAVVETLARVGFETEVRRTTGAGDARRWVGEAAEDDCDLVIVAGGDGTVREAVSGLVSAGGSTTLGVVPTGTANLFARALGVPVDDPPAAAAVAAGQGRRQIDVIHLADRDEHAVLMVDIGFDAELVRGASRGMKNVLGAFAYVASGVRNLVGLHEVEMTITVDAEEHEVRAHSVLCLNVGRIGQSVVIGSDIEPDDGRLHVGVVRRPQPWQVLWTAAGMVVAGRDAHPNVDWYAGGSVTIEARESLSVQVDGEEADGTPLELVLLPGAITVAVPDQA